MGLAEQIQFADALVNTVVTQARQIGDFGTPEYITAYNSGLAQLQLDRDNILILIRQTGGKQVTSVQAGESVTWSAPMHLQDQLGAYVRAIKTLMGMSNVRRTTARFLY